MTDLTSWLSPAVMHSLGWTLLHFLWQGTAIAAFAAAAMSLSRIASIRYAIGVGALSLMLAVPVATFFFLGQTASRPGQTASTNDNLPALIGQMQPISRTRAAASAPAVPSPAIPSPDRSAWLVEAWLLGVAFFSLRSAGAFLLVERQQRRESVSSAAGSSKCVSHYSRGWALTA